MISSSSFPVKLLIIWHSSLTALVCNVMIKVHLDHTPGLVGGGFGRWQPMWCCSTGTSAGATVCKRTSVSSCPQQVIERLPHSCTTDVTG